jgi:hypothetical protein
MTSKHAASSKIICAHTKHPHNERSQRYIGRRIPFFKKVAFAYDRGSDGRENYNKQIDANFDAANCVFKVGAHTCKCLCVR